jgi:hypothetical protein
MIVAVNKEREGCDDAEAAARRFGWRHSPRELIGLLIIDHHRSTGR